MTAAAPITNYNRKCAMVWAWDARRADPSRAFADCLRGAWKWIKKLDKSAAKLRARIRRFGRLDLSRSLIRSPASNAHVYGTTNDRHAGQMISRIGR